MDATDPTGGGLAVTATACVVLVIVLPGRADLRAWLGVAWAWVREAWSEV